MTTNPANGDSPTGKVSNCCRGYVDYGVGSATSSMLIEAILQERRQQLLKFFSVVEFDSPIAEYPCMFKVLYMKAARKRMRGLPPRVAKNIRAKIRAVAADPLARNPNLKRLQASSGYRLRVGDWRVFYSLDAKARTLTIEGVEPRGGAYQ